MSSTEKNRRRMLCAGDVANAGVASCAAGAEFGWYLATCDINTFNFISANHSKILHSKMMIQNSEAMTQAFILSSLNTYFFSQISMETMSKPCATTSRNVTSITFRKQSMRTRHRTTKPPNPHIHKTSKKIGTLLHNSIRP